MCRAWFAPSEKGLRRYRRDMDGTRTHHVSRARRLGIPATNCMHWSRLSRAELVARRVNALLACLAETREFRPSTLAMNKLCN